MSDAMQINIPDVLAEMVAMADRYEAALVGNDVQALDEMFWTNPHTIRYGARENLYGHAEILAFRKGRDASNLMRRVTRREITTFGKSFATTNLEFRRDDEPRIGRQSQCWVRLAEGWRIVSAHVSWMDA
ncbi:oxalurate catabolism protein HpxZ [Pontibaca salina]|uniref:Oxalurate catabolism protein HpxZ n=1 Tax=Pontibaca salina TaxID=2795731 RepID=A0A934HS48_9RHOB|nr:oxalurate catabolism protein HpxZ [Pontibaca salina]MBI6629213.1 oxalurate catabolism protein HpxZ [Pontibaca salina]